MYECPVCYHPSLEVKPYQIWPPPDGIEISPPYEEQLGRPPYEVCSLCEFEFGFDDDPGGGMRGDSFDEYRTEWDASRRPIFDASAMQANGEKGSG